MLGCLLDQSNCEYVHEDILCDRPGEQVGSLITPPGDLGNPLNLVNLTL